MSTLGLHGFDAPNSAGITAGRRAMLWMLAFVALWAFIEIIAAGLLRQYSPLQVVWARYAVHIALMLAWWGWREPGSLWRTRRLAYQVSRALLMLGMPMSWVVGLRIGADPAAFMAVFWLSPLFVLLLARALLMEKAPPALWALSLLAACGAVVASGAGHVDAVLPLAAAIGMAVTLSLYVVMTRSLRGEGTRVNLFYTAFVVWVSLLPFMPAVWITPAPGHALVMVAVGTLGWFALYALDRAAAAAPVSLSAPVIWLQLGFTAAFAGLAGHVRPDQVATAGLAVTVAVAVWVWVREPNLVVLENGVADEG